MSESPPGYNLTQQFIDALASVKNYNDLQTGNVFALGGLLAGMIGEEDATPRVSQLDEATMSRDMVGMLHTGELSAMGVELFDPDTSKSSEPVASPTGPPKLFLMRIADTEKFGRTVSELAPTQEQTKVVRRGLDDILSTTIKLVHIAYSGGSAPDVLTQQLHQHAAAVQLAMFAEVSPVLADHGFGDLSTHKALVEYSVHHAAGTLPDYLGAVKLGLTLKLGEFSPAQWQTDTTDEQLIERWQGAFAYLKSLRDRPVPSPFYSELFNKLRSDYDMARDNIRSTTDDPCFEKLMNVVTQLDALWEQEFPLENSFYLASKQNEH